MSLTERLWDLVQNWRERQKLDTNLDYKIGVQECAQELMDILVSDKMDNTQDILEHIPSKEAEQYLLEQEADSYLATIVAHEAFA